MFRHQGAISIRLDSRIVPEIFVANNSRNKRREENQPEATEHFTALIICSTRFGHLYDHHQELETILVLLPHMVCNALVACGRLLGAEQQADSD